MLLIDGARYELWTPEKEVEEFHPIVKEHIKDIFGENFLFIDASKLTSVAGLGSIPDGFVLIFGEKAGWHIIEIELSSHDVYKHIVDQVGRFINGINNSVTQRKVVDAIYKEITQHKILKAEVEEKIGSGEIYKFLNDLITQTPTLTIIIEEQTPELEEAIGLLKYSPIKIVEFQTFKRVGTNTIYAHLFEPIHELDGGTGTLPRTGLLKDLLEAGLLEANQHIYHTYKKNVYEAEVQIDGRIKLLLNGIIYNSPSSAAIAVTKKSENGWIFWQTIFKGKKCNLDEIRKQLKTISRKAF